LDSSIIQGPFSVAPCPTLISRFATFFSQRRATACALLASLPRSAACSSAPLAGGFNATHGVLLQATALLRDGGAAGAEGAAETAAAAAEHLAARAWLLHAAACRPAAGELWPLPVFPYRRVRIQRDQGRGGLGHKSTVYVDPGATRPK
jgi:hypothetical protein